MVARLNIASNACKSSNDSQRIQDVVPLHAGFHLQTLSATQLCMTHGLLYSFSIAIIYYGFSICDI